MMSDDSTLKDLYQQISGNFDIQGREFVIGPFVPHIEQLQLNPEMK